tara:strand:+ start:460 stop:957 length:498 start_codon:yes stop_codon:yes gene_type:complete
MKKISLKKLIFLSMILILIFFIDRTSKIYILNLADNEQFLNIYINKFLNIYLIWNTGIGFGLLSFNDDLIYNITTIIIIIINLIIIYFTFASDNIKSIFFTFILGGSLGNLFDRLYYSAVPDFIDINYGGYHWFIFNIADIFITLGIICLIIIELIHYKKSDYEK